MHQDNTASPPPALPKARGRSSTLEILGVPIRGGDILAKWADYHQSLTELRNRFAGNRKTRAETAKSEIQTSDEDFADGAADSYDRDCALAIGSSGEDALYEVEQALRRIADRTYGICEATGKPIEAKRLRAIPWTRYCAKAQAELEAGGAAPGAHLAVCGNWLASGETASPEEEEVDEPSP